MKITKYSILLLILPGSAITMERPNPKRKKETKAPIVMPNLEVELNIEPNSIQKTLLDLGLNRNYKEINSLIQSINDPATLEKIVLFQLNIGIFIVYRIKFNIGASDSYAFHYPVQQLTTEKYNEIAMQWLHLLLINEKTLNTADFNLKATIVLLRAFLQDIGYPPSNKPLKTSQDVKNALAENFRLLFKHLDVVMTIKQSFYLPKNYTLVKAISDNDAQKVEQLLNFGLPPQKLNGIITEQPLALALAKGYTTIINILIQAGASITKKYPISYDPQAALISIAQYERNAIVNWLSKPVQERRMPPGQTVEAIEKNFRHILELIETYEKLEQKKKE